MKKTLLLFFFSAFAGLLAAQSPRAEISKNVRCSAGNWLAYPGPTQHRLTAPPANYKPFFISHYGSQGSRYHTMAGTYNAPYLTLARADSLGKLTALGRDVMNRLSRIRQDAHSHLGELTSLGIEQNRQIMTRMFERFPEVFVDGADIDARSVTFVRCILSMEYALQQLAILNPRLTLHHNATQLDMNYLSPMERQLYNLKLDSVSQVRFNRFAVKYRQHDRLMRLLFNDMRYVRRQVDADALNSALFVVAGSIQSTDLRRQVTLYDLFTDHELYRNWQRENVWWYLAFGNASVNKGRSLAAHRRLLEQIVTNADSHIHKAKPGAALRFGHETVVLPLACLLDINGCGLATDDLNLLDRKGWVNYRISPAACNIQLVFYRRSVDDPDILFKVLLNENEATLPLKPVDGPYYRWSDFKAYYLKL